MTDRQRSWRNWADTVSASPEWMLAPRDASEVAAIVRRAASAGLRVKAVGSGHSFTGVAASDGVMLSLARIAGGLIVDPTARRVVVRAGTTLHQLNQELSWHGLAVANLGDIDRQSIAGAAGTGTHGTGASFTGLADQIVALTAVLADGSIVRCSPTENADLFECLRLGLGAFGVVVDVTLQCVDAFSLQAEELVTDVGEVLADLDSWVDSSDHFEFYWFPHSRWALTKRNTRAPAGQRQSAVQRAQSVLNDEVVSNHVLGVLCRAESVVPAVIPSLNRTIGRLLSDRRYTDESYRVFASRRRVVFREMEYAFPREHVADLVREIDEWTRKHNALVNLPIEVRWAAPDDVWLSTAHQRETAYIAVHQHHRLPHGEYFAAVESMMRRVDGRPHWGKIHTLTHEELRPLYPRFDDVRRVRQEVDPYGLFGNDYTQQVLGPVASES